MLTSIWSMLSLSPISCFLASLGGKGLFNTANIAHTADAIRRVVFSLFFVRF